MLCDIGSVIFEANVLEGISSFTKMDNVCFCATIWCGRTVSIKPIRLVDHGVYQLVAFLCLKLITYNE